MGVERLIAEAKSRDSLPSPARPTMALVAHVGDAAKESAFQLASELRRKGIHAVLAPPRGLRSQLRYADSIDATHAVILGDDELAKDAVVLRDLSLGQQEEIPRALLADTLR